ncbi:hypothetical protein E2562_003252 [Oryza meyeriana var. granulata]|uniref:Uncharacterized protein n=1 Tax=Oryza meyeriana var. granulata TaxID=110450 RepID=A0A6G1EUX4_9ORYZ|nr:hypothetical protein E2562_003252 [Oryza meyeriana var. granulata]
MAATAGDTSASAAAAFWTACPHCCYVHSYPRPYVGRRLRCPTAACRRAFSADELPSAPPVVPGADMYFCTWAFFPPVSYTHLDVYKRQPAPATVTAAPARAGPTSRKKVCVCLKGRARVEAEQEEEEEAAAAAVNLEAATAAAEMQGDGLGEKGCTGININEAVELSELGFRDDEIELFTAMS